MSAAPENNTAAAHLDGWPNNQDDPRPLNEAEAFALMFEGRDFSTQTQTQFFAVWALQAMRQSPAARWQEVGEAEILLAEALADALMQARPLRHSPVNVTDIAAASYVGGFYGKRGSADYPAKGEPLYKELAEAAFEFARPLCGAPTRNPARQPQPETEAAND